jgi:hypothetical protein
MNTLSHQQVTTLSAYINAEFSCSDYEDSIAILIKQRASLLTDLLLLSNANEPSGLFDFVRLYIHCSASHLQAFHSLAKEAAIQDYTDPFLTVAYQFFFDKHPIIDALPRGQALLCKAYLFHRMLEELNDRVLVERKLLLAPIDTVHTNLIAHTLIGDEHANLLDQKVLIQLELISASFNHTEQRIFQRIEVKNLTAQQRKDGWQAVLQKWPFLSHDISAVLN